MNSNQSDNKNFIIAMVAFAVITIGYNYFFDWQKEAERPEIANTTEIARPELTLDTALSKDSRVRLENDKIYGSIDLVGGVVDSVFLRQYSETTEAGSPNVRLFTPRWTHDEYYHMISYADKTNNETTAGEAKWTLVEQRGREAAVLTTRTGNGLIIKRTVAFDGYLINIKDEVANESGRTVSVSASECLFRANPKPGDRAVVHDGVVGNANGKVEEIKYSDIGQNTPLDECEWFGYTDIYWLCAIINKDKRKIASCSSCPGDSYQCSARTAADLQIGPGAEVELSYSIFAGPKDIRVLRECADKLGLHKFEMAIDFGWFFMITKPLLRAFGLLGEIFNSMWIVILLLTLLFKVATYPLTRKSFVSMAQMRELQPKMDALHKMYANDRDRLNQELIAIYKREKISPMSGCLPMLLQAPIFFCLYKVFYISIEMRHAPFFGWIHDLSSPDPAYIFNLFGAIDWTPPGFLQIGIWPLIMGGTMILQQKMTSALKRNTKSERASDQKAQENMMLIMPIIFTYICASCPVGVVVYWTISNVFSIVQQYYVNKHIAG